MTTTRAAEAVGQAIDSAIDAARPLVLAVSGGLDSMCLLHAVSRHPRRRAPVVVASFDHGTGPHAREAVCFVGHVAAAAGLEFVHGGSGAPSTRPTEATWRDARWDFLRAVASGTGGEVLTAHHHDDHIETVVMRALRGAGTRGLAGLRVAPSGDPAVHRPFLDLTRATLIDYAEHHRLSWVDDPTNQDRGWFRNRVRHDLLPALRAADPTFVSTMDRLSREAASLRTGLDQVAQSFEQSSAGGVASFDPSLLELSEPGRSLVWGALLHRARVILDRRGYARLAGIERMQPGDEAQLSGGYSVTRTTHALCVHRRLPATWEAIELSPEGARVGPWRFEVSEFTSASDTSGVWAWPAPRPGVRWRVRPWRMGDRWRGPGSPAPRLVARFLAEAGVPSSAREGWPVVETNGEIVWVPGTRRAPAAPASPGAVLRMLRCEFIDR